MMTNIEFKQLDSSDDVQKVISNLFDIQLNTTGGWGYDCNSAIIVEKPDVPYAQFYHMFATMRANIEMNLTLDEDKRYAGINLTLENIEEIKIDDKTYDVASFKITAINEKIYANFIKEYKDGYGKKEFDLLEHFKQRKENTITRKTTFWFDKL